MFFDNYYDGVGNRLTMNGMGYTYDAGDRLLQAGATTYGYDANGNMISKVESGETTNYTYDYANRLKSIVYGLSSIVYSYDGYGRRISRLAKGGGFGIPEHEKTDYLWDGTNVLVEFYQNKGNPLEYVYGNGQMISRDDLLVLPVSKRLVYQNSHWFHPDGLGSVVNLTDSNGGVKLTYEYDAFGEITKEQGQVGWKKNRYTFTGKPYDPTGGMYYFGARYYDAKVGRFITKDPWSCTPEDERIVIGSGYPKFILEQGLTNPQNTHPYMYCYNNPVIYIDLYGYCGEKEGIIIGGLLVTPAELLRMTGAVKVYDTVYAKRLDALLKWAARKAVGRIFIIGFDWIDPPILNEDEKKLLEEWEKKEEKKE